MKIGYCSDLHLEFYNKQYARDTAEMLVEVQKNVDLLVIAGDLHSDRHRRFHFLKKLSPNYLFVPGNHDFRKIGVPNTFRDGAGIASATLWTNFNNDPLAELAVRDWWDFRNILYWTTSSCKRMYGVEVEQIFNSSSEIVVTHFAPSLQSVEEKYKDAGVENYYFCNNLDERIRNSNKKLWVHGHVHSQHDYMIGNCRVVANPWGYPGECAYTKEVKVIEI